MNDYTLMRENPELYKKIKRNRFISDQLAKKGVYFDFETNTYHLRGKADITFLENNERIISHEG